MFPLKPIAWPGAAGLGVTDPVTRGGVGSELKVAVTLTSSIARPSSDPPVSLSLQRIQSVSPGPTDRLAMVALIALRHAALLPSVAPEAVVHASPSESKFSAA